MRLPQTSRTAEKALPEQGAPLCLCDAMRILGQRQPAHGPHQWVRSATRRSHGNLSPYAALHGMPPPPRQAHCAARCSLAPAPPTFTLPLAPRVPAHNRTLPSVPGSSSSPGPSQASRQQPRYTWEPHAGRMQARPGGGTREARAAEPGTPASAHTHAAPHATPALAPGTQPSNPSNRATTLACLPSKPAQTAHPQAAPAAQRGTHKRAAGSATPAGVSAASGCRSSARAPVAAAGSLCACGHSNLYLSRRCRAGPAAGRRTAPARQAPPPARRSEDAAATPAPRARARDDGRGAAAAHAGTTGAPRAPHTSSRAGAQARRWPAGKRPYPSPPHMSSPAFSSRKLAAMVSLRSQARKASSTAWRSKPMASRRPTAACSSSLSCTATAPGGKPARARGHLSAQARAAALGAGAPGTAAAFHLDLHVPERSLTSRAHGGTPPNPA